MARLDAKTCKWRDVLSIVNGKNQKEVESPNGAFPIYGSGGIIGYATDFLCPENTVVLGRKGSINKPIFVTEKFWNVDTAFGLVADENKIIPHFLYYFCVYFDFEKLNTTVTIPSLTKANLLDIAISLPDLAVQRKIVNQLAQIDKLISMKEKQLSKLDQLVKARFVEMFGDISTPKTALGRETLFIDYRGKTPQLADSGTIRMINAKSVGNGFFKYIDEFVSEQTYSEWMTRGFGKPNDILFVTEGHTFGNVCRIPNNVEKFALGQRVITIRCNQKIKNEFLCSYMQTDYFKKDIDVYKTGGTAQGIRSKDLAKILIPIPPLPLQEEFSTFVQLVDKSKSAVKQSLEKLETLKKSLMQEYFG